MSLVDIKSLLDSIPVISVVSKTDLYSGKLVPGCCGSPIRSQGACSKCNRWLSTSSSCPSCGRKFLGGSCSSCYQVYIGATPVRNHLSCIPLTVIKVELNGIVGKITSLKYSDFVRSNTENRQTLATDSGPGAGDLWESLVFQ